MALSRLITLACPGRAFDTKRARQPDHVTYHFKSRPGSVINIKCEDPATRLATVLSALPPPLPSHGLHDSLKSFHLTPVGTLS